jgi:transposase InsO family protein
LPAPNRLGTEAGRWRDRLRALDRLEGAEAGRDLTAAEADQGAGQQLRVAVPGRSAAHGHQPLRTFPQARPPRYRRPLTPWRRLDAPRGRVGTDYAHAIVDDHSRLAYVELHDDEKAATVTAFVERALTFFAAHGIAAKRLMTDNAWTYVNNRSLRELLAHHGIRHITTQPYRPRTNGKVERFHQTMAREWAYGLSYRTHRHRNQALPHWLDHYNRTRPHSSLGNRPPTSRVHNVRG